MLYLQNPYCINILEPFTKFSSLLKILYVEDSAEGDDLEYSNPDYTNSDYSQFDPDYPRDQPVEERMNQIDMPNGKINFNVC